MTIMYECEDCLWRGDLADLRTRPDTAAACPDCGSEYIEMLDDEGIFDEIEDDFDVDDDPGF